MQQHNDRAFGSSLQEEVVDAMSDRMAQIIVKLPPITRLRFLAFLHLLERPESVKACLDVEPTGNLRLLLSTAVFSVESPKH